jgi:hypothetical protein
MKKYVIFILILLLISLSPSYCQDKSSVSATKQTAKEKFEQGKLDNYDQGKYETAVEPFTEAIKFYSNSVEYNWYLVDCVVAKIAAKQKPEEAENSCQKLLGFYKDQIDININPFSNARSGLYFGQGLYYFMKDATYELDDRAFSSDKDDVKSLRNLRWFEINDKTLEKLKGKIKNNQLESLNSLKDSTFSKEDFLDILKELKFTQSDIETVTKLICKKIDENKLVNLSSTLKNSGSKKEEDFTARLESLNFTDKNYETRIIRYYATKIDSKNKEKVIENFTNSLYIDKENECAK